jgi:hypothetical protein
MNSISEQTGDVMIGLPLKLKPKFCFSLSGLEKQLTCARGRRQDYTRLSLSLIYVNALSNHPRHCLKGLSHEMDFNNVDEN